jgi:adenosylcobinamide-GDP ribazoletransferase
MSTPGRPFLTAPRFLPLAGAAVGAVGGGIYWLGAQVWPTSVAVVVSMLATVLLSARMGGALGTPRGTVGTPGDAAGTQTPALGVLGLVFAVLLKYNALMALSAASLPFALPANVALGLIMIAGNAASRALVVSMKPASHADLGIALVLGFAPAALIGLPGLVGLAAAIAARIALMAYLRRKPFPVAAPELDLGQQATEICFYLGALAAWAYI